MPLSVTDEVRKSLPFVSLLVFSFPVFSNYSCIFPFVYDDIVYYSCVSVRSDYAWCSIDEMFQGRWRYCTAKGECPQDAFRWLGSKKQLATWFLLSDKSASKSWLFTGLLLLLSLSHVWFFVTPWSVAHQVPLSVGFPRQEDYGGLPFLSPGDLPSLGTEPVSPASSALTGGLFITEPAQKPLMWFNHLENSSVW